MATFKMYKSGKTSLVDARQELAMAKAGWKRKQPEKADKKAEKK